MRIEMPLEIAFVMDPPGQIKPWKDTTFAMLLAAAGRGHATYYVAPESLFLSDAELFADLYSIQVVDQRHDFFTLGAKQTTSLTSMDAILMRKDPPFDMAYVFATHLLDHADTDHTLVVNRPGALRDLNEKLSTAFFPDCCPATLISRSTERLKAFVAEHRNAIVKPLDGMGGMAIFRARADDDNLNVILETATGQGRRLVMMQEYVEAITQGDRRILLIDGEPVPYALARIPKAGEFRGNLAQGGHGQGVALNPRERFICDRVGPFLRERGILFAGLDVIGDYLTEINVTSPTCVRELDAQFGLDIAGDFLRVLEDKLAEMQGKA